MIATLDSEGLLPAITFVFSRAGCDAAVQQCLRSPLRLTNEEERAQIAEVIEHRCGDLAEGDLAVLGYYEWREGLLRGLAAHHAGMLPAFRHTVEELFTAGWSRRCSPPRPWRWASICPPARWCSNGWSSSTARRMYR